MEVADIKRTLCLTIFYSPHFFLSCSKHLFSHLFKLSNTLTNVTVFCIRIVTVVHFNQLTDASVQTQCFLTHEQNAVLSESQLKRFVETWIYLFIYKQNTPPSPTIPCVLDSPGADAQDISQRKTN